MTDAGPRRAGTQCGEAAGPREVPAEQAPYPTTSPDDQHAPEIPLPQDFRTRDNHRPDTCRPQPTAARDPACGGQGNDASRVGWLLFAKRENPRARNSSRPVVLLVVAGNTADGLTPGAVNPAR